ncbi:MAG: polyprenyl synthetase family protein [Bacteroidota bacterium]|nr:polyprenyl synthetase family protein [Bacteroidota bacterium]
MYNQSGIKKIVNKALVNLTYNTESERLIDPVKYILSIGGKRLRPVLALMTCNLFTDKIDEAVIPVTGLEIFHNFTLVHDDIMDKAMVRRGFSTVHSKWSLNQAILSGDVMVFITNECFLQSPPHLLPRVFRVFNKAAIDVCTGQQLDMDYEKAAIVSHEEYLRMIGLKTAALIAASVRIGAMFGGADEKECDLIYEYGRNLGLAFQIQDDLLDTYGDSKVFGKISGGDIVASKKTFLFVKAMEIASSGQKKKLQEEYSAEFSDPEAKVKRVIEIYDQLNIRTITESLANDYFKTAISLLDKVGVPQERKCELVQITGSLVGRDH